MEFHERTNIWDPLASNSKKETHKIYTQEMNLEFNMDVL